MDFDNDAGAVGAKKGQRRVKLKTSQGDLMKALAAEGHDMYVEKGSMHSVFTLQGTVKDAQAAATDPCAYLTFQKGTKQGVFDFARKFKINESLINERLADELDTNLDKSMETNGNDRVLVHSMTLRLNNRYIKYAAADIPAGLSAEVAGVYQGKRPLFDPHSLMSPGICGNALLLHDPVDLALRKNALYRTWRDTTEMQPLYARSLPSGLAAPYVWTLGEPTDDNVHTFPDGIFWAADGEGSQIRGEFELVRDVSVPFLLKGVNGSRTPKVPEAIAFEYLVEYQVTVFRSVPRLPAVNVAAKAA